MPQELFPPEESWECPNCNKIHSKPHYEKEGQIDRTKKVGQEGRMKFGRELKDEPSGNNVDAKADCKRDDMETGNPTENVNGVEVNKGLLCPHCGYVQETLNIIKVKPTGKSHKATKTNSKS